MLEGASAQQQLFEGVYCFANNVLCRLWLFYVGSMLVNASAQQLSDVLRVGQAEAAYHLQKSRPRQLLRWAQQSRIGIGNT
jgi:hypothetical protein